MGSQRVRHDLATEQQHLDDTWHFPHVPLHNHDFTYKPGNLCFVTISSSLQVGETQGKRHMNCLGKWWRSLVSRYACISHGRIPGKTSDINKVFGSMNKLQKKELMRKVPWVELNNLTQRGELASVGDTGCRKGLILGNQVFTLEREWRILILKGLS